MFNQEQLQELLSYDTQTGEVLSLYLDTDSSQQPMDTIKLQARGLLKDASGFQKDVQAIERYIDHSYDWSKPGLAIFSGADSTFFRAYPVAVSFRNRLRVGHKPYVKPLAHLLDFYAHFGVILIDKMGSRFFEYHLGELQTTEGHLGEEIRKVKKGGGSSAVGMRGGQSGSRHETEMVQRNLRESATAANDFFNNKPVRRLFIGGANGTVAKFKEMLPKQWQSCVAGTFPIDMNAGEHEVRQHALTLLGKANAEREDKLVKSMITTYEKGGTAIVGLDETLQAICDKRVQTLIISDGYRAPGYVDEDSGFVIANLAKSPLSDRELVSVDDVVDAACAYTMTQGGHVEVIAGNHELEKIGRIGALLRY